MGLGLLFLIMLFLWVYGVYITMDYYFNKKNSNMKYIYVLFVPYLLPIAFFGMFFYMFNHAETVLVHTGEEELVSLGEGFETGEGYVKLVKSSDGEVHFVYAVEQENLIKIQTESGESSAIRFSDEIPKVVAYDRRYKNTFFNMFDIVGEEKVFQIPEKTIDFELAQINK